MKLSSKEREELTKRMAEHLKKTKGASEEKKEKVKEEVKEYFTKDGVDSGEHQKMFSELFFDPAELNLPDFAIDTFFHMHSEWPEWVVNSVPISDPHYVWNKRAVYAFMAGDDEHAFLVGDPGSGKTSLPKECAALVGRPTMKQAFQNDLEADEWIQSKEIDDTGTHWKTLPFVQFLSYPAYCTLDEFNRLRRGGRLLLNQLLNKGGSLQLRDGSEVYPHEQWRAIATDNARGLGDGLDKFDGDIADISTTDRFGLMLEVDYLPLDQQKALVLKWFPDLHEDLASDIVNFGSKVTEGYRSNSFALPWTPRRMEKAAKLCLRYHDLTAALQDAYYNFLADDDERKACNQCLKDVGIDIKFGEFK